MIRRALWRVLWRWVLLALVASWMALIAASYYAGLHEAEEITDAHLAAAVNVLLQVSAFGVQTGAAELVESAPEPVFQSFIPLGRKLDLTRSLSVVVWDGSTIVADSRPLGQRWRITPADGYSTVRVPGAAGAEAHQWRVFSSARDGGARRAAAMIDVEQRGRVGRHVASTIARPAIFVLPLIALLLWWALRRGLQPLNDLSTRVSNLDLDGGERLPDVYRLAEFDSVVHAINTLIDRLQVQLDRERAFAADVAHELRSPLAAIALQARNAGKALDAQVQQEALQVLLHEALRAGRILGELLELARAQRIDAEQFQSVSLGEIAASAMASFAQASHESGHQLELVPQPGDSGMLQGNAVLLQLAVGNLVANALQHTPTGTLVRIEYGHAADGAAWLTVSDDGQRSGNGVREAGPTRGSGIGLRLVERIALLHGARLQREEAAPPMTTRFALRWDTAHA